MEAGPESPEQRDVCGVAERLPAGIGAHGQLQPDRRQQDGRMLDRERTGQAPLDPTVLGRGDPHGPRDVGPAQPTIEAPISQFAENLCP